VQLEVRVRARPHAEPLVVQLLAELILFRCCCCCCCLAPAAADARRQRIDTETLVEGDEAERTARGSIAFSDIK
jgi:hypothetical protein